ncbi:CAMK family protein kinase [Trichomonas vaginalis G3]|uniref:CAMK family protein kinase n=1 Tax=Trichomonas vaginalis (strain ATCC PRA-98 / G3) TaxID=412133 RepID=A2EBT4_TRIV3|nr:protein serine/threonine kinase protein [Trichomonas vaginalis G3]EAY09896.1 CAMK family protein kinase [Trichomonas vaginalis G3]KAI5514664.1 protein serine/threonine kinase protein [Trichomonas vaginalis G3]|eukprot:XP_001322119.1 CAMK family protein kinase [Trichomonas vaginalis G3]
MQYGSNFALKKIPEEFFNQSEIDCLIAIDHPKIVSLYRYYRFDGCVYMLMEYCPNDLNKLMKSRRQIESSELYSYVSAVLEAVKACHDRCIAHSYIKPSNFFIDKYNRIKIGDFGLSKMYKDKPLSSLLEGTELFMAPEIFTENQYNPMKSDIWAVGVTIYFMATHLYPFYSKDPEILFEKIQSGVYSDDCIDDKNLCKVISSCLKINPYERLTINQLLELPYFQKEDSYSEENLPLTTNDVYTRSHQVFVRAKIPMKKVTIPLANQNIYQMYRGSRLRLVNAPSKSEQNFKL